MAIVYGRVQRCDNGNGIFATLTDNWGNIANTDIPGTFYSTVAYNGYRLTASAGGYTAKNHFVTQAEIQAGWVTICLDALPIVEDRCCFTGATRVLMGDGSEMPIEHVRQGDVVLGQTGSPNRVLRVVTPRLGQRALYSINGEVPFVTGEHPFLTVEGWKAIEPEAARKEGVSVEVRKLVSGNRLMVCKGCLVTAGSGSGDEPAELAIEPVDLRFIRATQADPMTPLYNLMLDGDHTYIAAGFVVHNKGGLY